MYININNLIKIYNKNFGTWSDIKSSIKDNKVILIPLSTLLISVFSFYTNFFISKPNVILIIVSIVVATGSFIWIYFIQKKIIENKYGGLRQLKKGQLHKAECLFKVNLDVEEIEEYKLLEVLVNKEIEEHESKSFPFINTIKQLVLAIFIAGLLSYSVSELADGNGKFAYSLLLIYLFIIGTLIIIGLFTFGLQEFTKKYKLRKISKLLIEIQLKKTIELRMQSRESNM